MKKIKFLKINFDTPLKPFEIPAFRSAIIDKAGREHILFHNHLNDEKYLFGYPVIQYKSIKGKAAIVCIDYGTDEIYKLFQKKDQTIKIGSETRTLNVEKVLVNQYNLNVWDKTFFYSINNWVALSSENYQKYQLLTNELDKEAFLEKILIGNIISMAKGIKWQIDKEIKLKITDITDEHFVSFKENKLHAFNVSFKTNVFLPSGIGLGKSVSFGFGNVIVLKKETTNE